MQPKRGKYDTNPLDENVAERADRDWGRDTGTRDDPPTQAMSGAPTSEIGRTSNEAARANPETEAPTRRIDDSYRSVFAYGQSQAATYQPPRMPDANIYQPPPGPPPQIYQPPPGLAGAKPGSQKVAGLGIPEKWAVMLPYIPFFIAMVAAIVELLLVPRTEKRVRFHAAQGLVLQIGITAISTLLGFANLFSGRFTGASLFSAATFVFLIISMIRVWQGKPHHIALLDPATNWVEDKINPRK
ncbi:MAG TPA: hypothetical protein VFZ40_05020 [Pyrinomonadaceae bacterium]